MERQTNIYIEEIQMNEVDKISTLENVLYINIKEATTKSER